MKKKGTEKTTLSDSPPVYNIHNRQKFSDDNDHTAVCMLMVVNELIVNSKYYMVMNQDLLMRVMLKQERYQRQNVW